MPKMKKGKKYSFAKTKTKGREGKDSLVDNVREAVDDYDHCYVFDFQHFRQSKMKEVRTIFKDSRFFAGSNKVMQVALGRTSEDSYADNIYKLSPFLRGHCGLFFTNRNKKEIKDFFKNYASPEYARMNDIAESTITLDKGPLDAMQFPVPMDPYLRKLGLNTEIVRGVIHLLRDTHLCEEGKPITAEGSRLLKLLDHKLVGFKLTLTAHWSKDTGTARRIKSTEE
jgi:mRNA turnover protein 4|uniref:Ribosome assembly factor mrt4 n=1 Tax=Eutreptiella gymnastica TaxID=73025 RepID=A0A7S4LHZ3_9EUGL